MTLGMLLWRCPRITPMRLRQYSAAHRRPGPRLAAQRPRLPQPCRCLSIIAYLLPLLLFCLIPSALAQKTIHIPTDQPTIQAGINAAGTGDTGGSGTRDFQSGVSEDVSAVGGAVGSGLQWVLLMR